MAIYFLNRAMEACRRSPLNLPTYPVECELCHKQIESADDATFWHGYGNCVEITPELEEQWRKDAEYFIR